MREREAALEERRLKLEQDRVRQKLANFKGDLNEFLNMYITSINCEQLKWMTYTLVEERRSKKVNTLLAELRSRLSAKLIKEPIEEIGYAITVELDSWEQTQCEVLEVVKKQHLESW